MSIENWVDPWGDLSVPEVRGLFTGNRGCLVSDSGKIVRHHKGALWIICQLRFKGMRKPLNAPRTWTPLFFLDDAVGLAAGHRPCGYCRRREYAEYRNGVTEAAGSEMPLRAPQLNRRLAAERLTRGTGLTRARNRLIWSAHIDSLPIGTVILNPEDGEPALVTETAVRSYAKSGWGKPTQRPKQRLVDVLTPPTSVTALNHGFRPQLHRSALKD